MLKEFLKDLLILKSIKKFGFNSSSFFICQKHIKPFTSLSNILEIIMKDGEIMNLDLISKVLKEIYKEHLKNENKRHIVDDEFENELKSLRN